MALSISEAIREDDIDTGTTKNIKTGTDAGGRHIQFMAISDTDGNHTAPGSYYNTGGTAEASAVVSGSATRVKSITMMLDPTITTSRWCMGFNATSLPADGAAPDVRFLVAGAGASSKTYAAMRAFSTGLVLAVSTTPGTLTVATSGEAYFDVEYA